MSRKEIMNKVGFVVFGKDAEKVWLKQTDDGKWCLFFDAHGLTVPEAKKILKNIIAILPISITLVFIHGYHSGTALKSMVRSENFGYRLQGISTPWYNPGESHLQIAAMRGYVAG